MNIELKSNFPDFKKLISACSKISKSVDIDIDRDAMRFRCGGDFNIKANARSENFEVFEIKEPVHICRARIDDLSALMIKKRADKVVFSENDGITAMFFDTGKGFEDALSFQVQLGERC